MNNKNNIYGNMINTVSENVNALKDRFVFAAVTDTHLDNSLDSTVSNICAVDKAVGFRCLVHLGDFLNGNLPRHYTRELLDLQMYKFGNCISNNRFYPVQGNHDGFCDLKNLGAVNVALNCDWYKSTAFLEQDKNVFRDGESPFYYVDFKEEKIRMIILCTFYNKGSLEDGDFEKIYGTDDAQLGWFKNTALDVDEDWTIMVFSHDTPFERFDENVCCDNPRTNGNNLMDAIKYMQNKKHFNFAAWFVGHFHGDFIGRVNGINFVVVASQTAYVPALWDMPKGGYYPERVLGTPCEDCWDAIVLDKDSRKLRLFRFGAGFDREIGY